MLEIRIASLKEGVHEFVLDPEASAVALDPERFADIHVEVRLDVHADRVLADLKASAMATLECDRTLQLFQQALYGSYTVLFASPDLVAQDEAAYDDVRVLLPSDQAIDLTEVVRDTLLLEIPARCVAPGADDLDLPTRFGEAEGARVDERWEALRKLRSDPDV